MHQTGTSEVIRKTTHEKLSMVRRIWHANGSQPHLVKTFKGSNDARFAKKPNVIVGLYLNPPERAMVLCADEKSQF